MRRALLVSWAFGTSAGVLLGLYGVALVTDGITGGRVPPLSRPEVLAALRAEKEPDASGGSIAAPPSDSPPSDSPPSDAALPSVDEASTPASTAPAGALPRPEPVAGPPPTTTTTPPPPAVLSPPITAAPPPEPAEDVRTITARGGSVAVRYAAGEVALVWARPNDGFDVRVVSEGPKLVYVVFSGEGRSRVFAYYEEGEPSHRVVESERGGDGGDDGDDRRRRGDRDG